MSLFQPFNPPKTTDLTTDQIRITILTAKIKVDDKLSAGRALGHDWKQGPTNHDFPILSFSTQRNPEGARIKSLQKGDELMDEHPVRIQ